jgi:carboxyl-terminal processing protease
MMENKKLQVWLPLLFSVVMITGMFFGYKLNPGQNHKGFFETTKSTPLQEAVDVIRRKYVDEVNLDSLESGAIEEMMTHLDPHSVYFPPVELKEANEELAANFDGIGIEFNIFNDTVNVVYVLPGGPSDEARLQIGDKILKTNDSSLVNRDINKIKELIRGERGTTAELQVLRNGAPLKVKVTRGSIPQFSVDAAYMVDKTTGYIKLNKFTETSYEEVMKAMEDLQKQGMQALVFDLRDNRGGYMNEAIDIADEFLSDDKLIVFTEGAHSKRREYRCKRPGLFEKGKLAVLLDENSASASEVLAGALQDWDRAVIIGRRSFGKGLVQDQFPLGDGSALRLTIARYFTPLGRSIQRPYDKGKKVYMEEIMDRYSNGEALNADSSKFRNGKQFKTPNGTILYGGGGIMPQIFIPIDTATYPAGINVMILNGSFNNFVYLYYLKNRKLIDQYSSPGDYIQRFNRLENVWEEFVNYAATQSVDLKSVTAAQKQALQKRLEAFLARFRWRNYGYFHVLNDDDEAVKKAVVEVKK